MPAGATALSVPQFCWMPLSSCGANPPGRPTDISLRQRRRFLLGVSTKRTFIPKLVSPTVAMLIFCHGGNVAYVCVRLCFKMLWGLLGLDMTAWKPLFLLSHRPCCLGNAFAIVPWAVYAVCVICPGQRLYSKTQPFGCPHVSRGDRVHPCTFSHRYSESIAIQVNARWVFVRLGLAVGSFFGNNGGEGVSCDTHASCGRTPWGHTRFESLCMIAFRRIGYVAGIGCLAISGQVAF